MYIPIDAVRRRGSARACQTVRVVSSDIMSDDARYARPQCAAIGGRSMNSSTASAACRSFRSSAIRFIICLIAAGDSSETIREMSAADNDVPWASTAAYTSSSSLRERGSRPSSNQLKRVALSISRMISGSWPPGWEAKIAQRNCSSATSLPCADKGARCTAVSIRTSPRTVASRSAASP